jgi:hypothetical protein
VAERHHQPGLVRELRQPELEPPGTRPIPPPAVGLDQQGGGVGVETADRFPRVLEALEGMLTKGLVIVDDIQIVKEIPGEPGSA